MHDIEQCGLLLELSVVQLPRSLHPYGQHAYPNRDLIMVAAIQLPIKLSTAAFAAMCSVTGHCFRRHFCCMVSYMHNWLADDFCILFSAAATNSWQYRSML
ncbi:TPA: hypothetical protein ACH3X2_011662 [Trebouxia sp. C0005]